MAPPAIAVEDLHVAYGAVRAVDGVSFTVHSGQVVTLLGPNGAGKTTTVETLEGYRRPASGVVRVLGLDPVADRRRLAPRIGVMLQSGGVHPGIRPLEALRLYAAFYAVADDPDDALERVGLGHRRRATWRQLSGGEQQRLSLALALIGRPQVAFLDEPTAGIDVSGRQLVREIIGELRDRGVAVLVTTHDLDDAERTADRIVIIDRGRIVAAGTRDELLATGDSGFRFTAPAGIDTSALGAAVGATVDEVGRGEYVVHTEATPPTVAAVTSWLAANDIAIGELHGDGRERLEDLFIRLTGGPAAP